jgi:hypothetical protein
MGQSSSSQSSSSIKGVNDIPPPQFDANANAPPREQHNRVIDFIRVSRMNSNHLCRADLIGSTSSNVGLAFAHAWAYDREIGHTVLR